MLREHPAAKPHTIDTVNASPSPRPGFILTVACSAGADAHMPPRTPTKAKTLNATKPARPNMTPHAKPVQQHDGHNIRMRADHRRGTRLPVGRDRRMARIVSVRLR